MLLAVNVGNSTVAYGIFDRRSLHRHGRRWLSDAAGLPNEIGDEPVATIALATVAPARTGPIIEALSRRYEKPVLVVGKDLPIGIEVECDEPCKVGADRLLNAVAAYERIHAETIVVDVGTAITVDVVSDRGSFCGGAIAPGPETMLRALAEFTELLPEVSFAPPTTAVGRNTVAAMRSGTWHGTIGIVRELIGRMAAERGTNPTILVTGGAGGFVAEGLGPHARFVPHLTLEGLAILVERTD